MSSLVSNLSLFMCQITHMHV